MNSSTEGSCYISARQRRKPTRIRLPKITDLVYHRVKLLTEDDGMIYDHIKPATFLERLNRFTAHIAIDGRVEKCHVKNTRRCWELLYHGAPVLVQNCSSPAQNQL